MHHLTTLKGQLRCQRKTQGGVGIILNEAKAGVSKLFIHDLGANLSLKIVTLSKSVMFILIWFYAFMTKWWLQQTVSPASLCRCMLLFQHTPCIPPYSYDSALMHRLPTHSWQLITLCQPSEGRLCHEGLNIIERSSTVPCWVSTVM